MIESLVELGLSADLDPLTIGIGRAADAWVRS
jgi:hypothetical protein